MNSTDTSAFALMHGLYADFRFEMPRMAAWMELPPVKGEPVYLSEWFITHPTVSNRMALRFPK